MKTIAEFRDFEIEERDSNTICIIQSDHNEGEGRIFLDKKQIPLLISALSGNIRTSYIADLTCNVDGIECYTPIIADTVQELFDNKKDFFESFVYDLEGNPYRGDDTQISNIRKYLMIDLGDK